jgi:hypothetical protein
VETDGTESEGYQSEGHQSEGTRYTAVGFGASRLGCVGRRCMRPLRALCAVAYRSCPASARAARRSSADTFRHRALRHRELACAAASPRQGGLAPSLDIETPLDVTGASAHLDRTRGDGPYREFVARIVTIGVGDFTNTRLARCEPRPTCPFGDEGFMGMSRSKRLAANGSITDDANPPRSPQFQRRCLPEQHALSKRGQRRSADLTDVPPRASEWRLRAARS